MLLEINMKFIFNILFFSFLFFSCDNNPDTWINNTIKSEKDVLMATSIDLKKLISKSNLGNINFLTSDQKLIYSVFKSSFNSSLLGFNIDLPQKIFVINEPGKINGAIFLAGNIEDFKTFKQNLSSFFGVDKFTSSNPTICFSSEYNISFGFNESNFLAAFSLDKNFSEAKISDYFKQENTNQDNEYISEFINLKDDFSFYISYSKINRLINNLNNDFIKSQINSRVNINEFSEDVILSLNFLEGKINCKLKSNPKFYDNFSNGVLNKNFKSLVPKNDSLFSFVFANIKPNNIESYFSKLSKLGFSLVDNNSIINFKELIPLMNGSIMFSLNNSFESALDSLDSGYVLKDSLFKTFEKGNLKTYDYFKLRDTAYINLTNNKSQNADTPPWNTFVAAHSNGNISFWALGFDEEKGDLNRTDLNIVNLNRKDKRRIFDLLNIGFTGQNMWCHDISEDGKWLLFSTDGDIVLIELENPANIINLTNSKDQIDIMPKFNSDDTKIVYSSGDGKKFNIFTMNFDGGNKQAHTTGNNHYIHSRYKLDY